VRQFVRITLPLLAPVIFFNLVLQTIEAFKAFTQAYIISGGTGGPVDSTLFYSLYLYEEAFANFRMGLRLGTRLAAADHRRLFASGALEHIPIAWNQCL
jgi:ABC-type sugar transport system permease subunit